MERVSAACAMEWSVELEKALRSKKPGVAVKAIRQIGRQLLKWSKEPVPTTAVCSMFGLVPGEDRLFANTILLRLADAFRLGDKETRLSIVNIFLSEQKSSSKYGGILSKARVNNQAELLKRAKLVFDTGDAESRALALILFGCWADFAIDSAHIRYLVLSSLVSSNVLEAKASIFAAGCFCKLAGDFASVVLEMLIGIVTSPETPPILRIYGVRAFAKFSFSHSVASRAYKAGVKLVLDSTEEDFTVAMLVSLSNLASKSSLFIFEQVDLLFSFLSLEKTLRLRATALRCLHFIFSKAAFEVSSSAYVITTLVNVVGEIELPLAMQYEALQILHKIFSHIPIIPYDNMPELSHLLTSVEKSALYSTIPKNLRAICVLVNVSIKVLKQIGTGSVDNSLPLLPVRLISIIVDQIGFLLKSLFDWIEVTEVPVFQDVMSLLKLLLSLVCKHPDLVHPVLDNISLCVQQLVDMHSSDIAIRQSRLSVVDFKRVKPVDFRVKLMCIVHNFFLYCLECLNEAGAITSEILDKSKLFVEDLLRCNLFGGYIHAIYSLLFHSQIMWSCVVEKNKDNCSLDGSSGTRLYDEVLVESGILTLGSSKKMLAERDKWPAYRTGTFAACQGVWVTAAFLFDQLTTKIQYESFSCWLKSVADFAQSERNIQLFLFPKLGSSINDWSSMNESPSTNFNVFSSGATDNMNESNSAEVLIGAYHGISCSGKRLESMATPDKSFCFQRWFLALRAKVLGTVADLLKILGNIPLHQENSCMIGQNENRVTAELCNSMQQLCQISARLSKLAQEYDFVATSFSCMDSRSLKVISALALSCSLLAFTAGFALFVGHLPANQILMPCDMGSSKNLLQGMIIQNLSGRLWFVDRETCSNLCQLSEGSGQAKVCFHMQPRNQNLGTGSEGREILNICKYAISGICGLQLEAKKVQNEEIPIQVMKDGLRILFNTIVKWMHIPFRVPKFFFNLRGYVGSEIFALNADTRKPADLAVSEGFQLALNLCLQLRNVTPDLQIQMTKSYCILYLCKSFQEEPSLNGEAKGEAQLQYGAWDSNDMIKMNEELFRYVMDSSRKTDDGKRGRLANDDGIVTRYVCFELNDKSQGFANCLLDVSNFPVGCYRIKWQSCYIDTRGCYWSLLPLNRGPIFTVHRLPVTG